MVIIDDEEGSEVPRQSLLDVVLEKKQRQGKAKLEDRISILAKTNETQEDDEEVRDYFLDLFDLSSTDEETCTGITLVYPTACVIVVEAEQAVLWDFMKRLHSSELDNAPVNTLKILSSSRTSAGATAPYSVLERGDRRRDADRGLREAYATAANISILQLAEKLNAHGNEAQELL